MVDICPCPSASPPANAVLTIQPIRTGIVERHTYTFFCCRGLRVLKDIKPSLLKRSACSLIPSAFTHSVILDPERKGNSVEPKYTGGKDKIRPSQFKILYSLFYLQSFFKQAFVLITVKAVHRKRNVHSL